MKDLRDGKAVLIDFWTYSCINCIRTLPHLKAWHEKYSPYGLVIVGVHTPEFEFEKNVGNVERALKEFNVTYPVVMDSDYQIWSLYSNKYWPNKFLVSKDGQIVYDHAGEGGYKETEEQIEKALLEINPKLKLPAATDEEGGGGICYPATPETYLGTMRGQSGRIWKAIGAWKAYPEYIEHVEKTPDYKDCLALNFEGVEVNLVMESQSDRPVKIRPEVNGEPLKEIEVRESKMYNLWKSQEYASGELKIFVKDAGFRAYAFTFGGCP